MSTYEQRELAGVSPITQSVLPSESKHDLDDRRDEAKLHRIEAKELREFNRPMMEYNKAMAEYKKDLSDVLGNPRDEILRQIKAGNYKNIPVEEAMHIPYRRVS